MKGFLLISTISGAVCVCGPKNHLGAFLFQSYANDGQLCVNGVTSGSHKQRRKTSPIHRWHVQLRQHPSGDFVFSPLQLKRGKDDADDIIMTTDNKSIMANLEKEVRANAQATLDLKRVTEALTDSKAGVYYEPSSFMKVSDKPMSTTLFPEPSQWKIAISAGVAASLVSFLIFHQPLLSFAIFLATTIIAARDPMDERVALIDGKDDVAGPVARLIGRATLKSIEESTPKVRAMTKAAVTGSAEIDFLRGRIGALEEENASLALWIERRTYVDEHVGDFTLEQLKAIAREEGLAVGGTKIKLMMRLAEAEYFDSDGSI